MAAERADWFVRTTMRVLAVSFAAVGILFIAAPDGVIGFFDDLGDSFGTFAEGPESEQKLWLALGFAYMVVITGIAAVVSTDPARHRPMLLVLAAGKAASSLAAGAFFLERDVFIYLANFVVDGGLVGLSLLCWSLAGRAREREPAAAATPG